MNIKTSVILALALVSVMPSGASAKKKPLENGMLESMEAVPCGAKQRGLSGVGGVWASVGVTHVNSDEKLCPQYVLRTDNMDYQIRPTDGKHPVVLPVGHEAEFKVKKDLIFLKVRDSDDQKTRTYQVVAMKPPNPDSAQQEPPTTPTHEP